MCAMFSPEILQALAVKGLKHIMSVAQGLHQHLASPAVDRLNLLT